MKLEKKEKKNVFFISIIGSIFASLCCLTPIVLVLLGLSSVTFAASVGDFLYGTYKWAFRGAGLLLAFSALYFYFRRRGICTVDDYMKNRNKIINIVALTVIAFIVIYLIFNYIILEIMGIKLNLWKNPFERLFNYF